MDDYNDDDYRYSDNSNNPGNSDTGEINDANNTIFLQYQMFKCSKLFFNQ